MANKLVLMFAGESTNDAIFGQMSEYASALTESGVSIVHIGGNEEEFKYAFGLIAEGKVGFAFTWLGIAQNLTVARGADGHRESLWDAFGIPMLKIQGDLPAYYLERHQDQPKSTVNLYLASEFIHFRRRWLPDCRAMTAQVPTFPIGMIERHKIDSSKRRTGKLVFLKNGNAPGELVELWNTRLPGSVANLLRSMGRELEAIGLKPGPLHIGDFVADFLSSRGIEPDSTTYMVRFMSAQLDDYLRRVKSRMIAEALLDLPVIVQGTFWHHLDFTGRRAELRPGQSYAETRNIYAHELGIIDMSPNIDSCPHERVQRAAGAYTTVLTNKQSWMNADFPEFPELGFEFTPESIRACVEKAIADPARFVDMGVAFGEQYRTVYSREQFANRVIDIAELAALQWSAAKPQLQEFFGWTDPAQY